MPTRPALSFSIRLNLPSTPSHTSVYLPVLILGRDQSHLLGRSSLYSPTFHSAGTQGGKASLKAFLSPPSVKPVFRVAFALKLASFFLSRLTTNLSLLGPPFSGMPVLTVRAALAAHFTNMIFFALMTQTGFSLALQKSVLSSKVFLILTTQTKMMISPKRWGICSPTVSMPGPRAYC